MEAEGKGSGGEGERGTLGWRERGSPALLIPLLLESFTSFSLCWLPPPNAVFMPSCLFPTLSSFFVLLLKYAYPQSVPQHLQGILGHSHAPIKASEFEYNKLFKHQWNNCTMTNSVCVKPPKTLCFGLSKP